MALRSAINTVAKRVAFATATQVRFYWHMENTGIAGTAVTIDFKTR